MHTARRRVGTRTAFVKKNTESEKTRVYIYTYVHLPLPPPPPTTTTTRKNSRLDYLIFFFFTHNSIMFLSSLERLRYRGRKKKSKRKNTPCVHRAAARHRLSPKCRVNVWRRNDVTSRGVRYACCTTVRCTYLSAAAAAARFRRFSRTTIPVVCSTIPYKCITIRILCDAQRFYRTIVVPEQLSLLYLRYLLYTAGINQWRSDRKTALSNSYSA